MGVLNAGSGGWCLRWPATASRAVHRQVGVVLSAVCFVARCSGAACQRQYQGRHCGGKDVGAFAALGQGLLAGRGLVSVFLRPLYFGDRRPLWARRSSISGDCAT